MSSARGAAADYIQLVDSQPAIDAEATDGENFDFENAQGHIRFENVSLPPFTHGVRETDSGSHASDPLPLPDASQGAGAARPGL